MKSDLNKGITDIQYNSLNLPRMMDIKSPVAEARNEYLYSAGGQKLRVTQKWNSNFSTAPVIGSTINAAALNMTKTTDYVGNKVYENNSLKRILVDGGYIENNVYHYYLTDHLGNNRIVAKQDGTPVQKTHYYPFGSSFAVTTGAGLQPYKYNNKELDQMHGLNLYDYHARQYESAIGRFTTPDPHAENYYSWSPYVYALNNPLRYIDPLGTDTVHVNPDGTPQRYPDGSIISHPGGETVLIQDQPLPEVVIEGKRILKPSNGTVAIGYSTGVSTSAIVEGSGNVFTYIKILKGPDAGKWIYTVNANIGGGFILDVSANMSITSYNYYGDLDNFRATTFEGYSNYVNRSVGEGVILGVGTSEGKDVFGGTLSTRTFSIGAGVGSPINVSGGISSSSLPRKFK